MKSGGMVWLPELSSRCAQSWVLNARLSQYAVNCERAKESKKPLRFGTLSPPDGSSIKLGDWQDEDIRKELTWLNEERAKAGKEETEKMDRSGRVKGKTGRGL
jgi:hypothetical protein